MDKILRLVRISLLISAIQRVLRFFFLGKLFYKSNRKLFSCVCIAWYKYSRRWENSRKLCKPSTSSRVCITVSNSPNLSRVYIRLCKHGKRFLLLKCITKISAFRLANSVSIYPQNFSCQPQINWCTFIINCTQNNVIGAHTNTSALMNYFILDPSCFVMTTKQGGKNLTREQYKRIIILLAFNCPDCHQN